MLCSRILGDPVQIHLKHFCACTVPVSNPTLGNISDSCLDYKVKPPVTAVNRTLAGLFRLAAVTES